MAITQMDGLDSLTIPTRDSHKVNFLKILAHLKVDEAILFRAFPVLYAAPLTENVGSVVV